MFYFNDQSGSEFQFVDAGQLLVAAPTESTSLASSNGEAVLLLFDQEINVGADGINAVDFQVPGHTVSDAVLGGFGNQSLTLSVSPAIWTNQPGITVGYVNPGDGLKNPTSGVQVASFSGLVVDSSVSTVPEPDTTAPVITVTGDNPYTHRVGSGPYVDPGATATDNVDGSVSVTTGGDSVTDLIASGLTITYDAVDAAGNNATQQTRTVNVEPAAGWGAVAVDSPVLDAAGYLGHQYSGDAPATGGQWNHELVTSPSGLAVTISPEGAISVASVATESQTFSASYTDPAGVTGAVMTFTLEMDVILSVDDSQHGVSSDDLSLTQSNTLVVEDATHTLAVEDFPLTQENTLEISNTAHTVAADAATLAQSHTLSVQDGSMVQSVSELQLLQGNTLEVESTLSSQTVENISLTQQQILGVDSASHITSSEEVNLNQTIALSVQDSQIQTLSSTILLDQETRLSVADSSHGISADNIALIYQTTLEVADTYHQPLARPVAFGGGEFVVDRRVVLIKESDRLMKVA